MFPSLTREMFAAALGLMTFLAHRHVPALILWWGLLALPGHAASNATPSGQSHSDAVYLQETNRKISSAEPLNSVAVFAGRVCVGSDTGLYELNGDKLIRKPDFAEPVKRLVGIRDTLWAITGRGLHRLQSGAWKKITDELVTDVTAHLDTVVVSAGKRLFRVNGEVLEPLAKAECPFSITRVISHCETLYASGGGRLSFLEGERFGGLDLYGFPADQTWDWGSLPSTDVREVLSSGSGIYFATARGVGLLRGMSLTGIRGEQGLCYEDATALARGFTNDLWIGTTRGAIRMVDGKFHYFAGQRWLPDDRVRAVAAAGSAVYIATDKGLGVIEYEPFTLLKKAAYYERHLVEWGQKRLGFVHKLEWDDALKEFVREAGDNDGGYSGNYLAAQSYRFAVTKDPEARSEAANTFQSLCWLEKMTGIPGFPARSVWVKGERGHKAGGGSGGYPAEWHDTADGKFEWKGDTSSDELCSHFHAITLFLEHVAQGAEIQQAKQYLASVATHLIDHGWQLIDRDGKPTRWGRWDPDYFKTEEGLFDRGLQSLELLSFIKTAEALTGDTKFTAAYRRLMELGYPEFTLRQRQTFPTESVLHFEDELSLWCYSTLLKFEKDPRLRSIYRRSFERSYEVIRIEQNPWFNFIYGSLTKNECEVAPALNHLREWPLDLIVWSYQNSHRTDLKTPPDYLALKGGTKTFSPRETEPLRWDHWLMQADGGAGGRDVVEPAGWLMAYWMGRYHGYIAAPETAETALLTVERNRGRTFGAKPYDGPPRPEPF